jgi:hypothetical protein
VSVLTSLRRHGCLLPGYVALGVVATWPRATYLVSGRLPDTRDQGAYAWDMWRMLVRLADR